MKKTLPYQSYDAQDAGAQYLEDLATGYWFSEVLFTAVEMGLFSLVGTEGSTVDELAGALDADRPGMERLLRALCAMGLIANGGQRYFNTKLSTGYLLPGKDQYQGDSILWRKYLHPGWHGLRDCLRKGGRVDYPGDESSPERIERIKKYIRAMDGIAKVKAAELVRFFGSRSLKGKILDVGTRFRRHYSGFS